MIDIKSDPATHQTLIVNGDLVLVFENEELAQWLKEKLLTYFGEWFADTTAGIKYYEEILIKAPDLNLIEDIFRLSILEEPEVVELLKFNTEFDNGQRRWSISFTALTSYNTTITIEGLEVP